MRDITLQPVVTTYFLTLVRSINAPAPYQSLPSNTEGGEESGCSVDEPDGITTQRSAYLAANRLYITIIQRYIKCPELT